MNGRAGRAVARAGHALWSACLLAAAALPGANVYADGSKPPEPADADLIEFLGSVDSDDADWRAYLARVEATKPVVAKPTQPPPDPASAPKKDAPEDEQ